MSERRIETYEEFWPFYVREHANKTNRRLHFIGSTGSLLFAIAAIVRKEPKHLLHALVSGYGGAWIGHFFFEKNKPASFKYPLWSFVSDWKMYAKILTGQMDEEVARALAEEEARKEREASAEKAAPPEKAEPALRPQDLN
jgi:hypothetical protein